jgi:hypothetical protein
MAETTPADLLIVAQPDTNKNYFNFKATGLKLDKSYSLKFQWIYPDGAVSDWSPVYSINTSTESVPAAPTVTVSGGAGFIQVSLPTFPVNASRVDVRIAGGIFGDGTKVADSFTSAGTKTIAAPGSAAPGLAYVVTLLTVTPSKINGDPSSPVTVYVTDPAASIAVEPSETPSTPTVSPVLGAIQLAWNGKTATGESQPLGFDAAKVYVGTTADFTPVDTGSSGANQVDILNFANGQNTLNIAVGTVVNGTALTYNTNYYVKIKTTNGNVAQDSIAVAATGNPVQIGKVGSGDIVSITADQITTGTISSQVVTVGAASGKHVKLSGTGDPLTIYGTGGTGDPLLSFGTNAQNESILTIKGSGSFTGSITGASGTFSGNLSASNGLFSVNNGILTAQSGTIGGWKITGSVLESSDTLTTKISLNPATPKIALISGGVEKITIDPVEGIKDSAGNFTLTPAGILTVKGSITSGSTITGADITMTGAGGQTGLAPTKLFFQSSNYAISAGASSYTYGGTSGYYDSNGDWVSATSGQTITNNDIRFTDNTLGGGIPSAGSSFYYGEMWLGSGNSAGSVDLWSNYPGGYIGISVVADSSSKNIYMYGDSSAGFTTFHRNSTADPFKESPAFLQVDSGGRVSRGRAVITGGSSNPSNDLGLTGDLYFSTAT